MADSWKKKEREQRKKKAKVDKAGKKLERKEKAKKSFDDMIAYIDEDGNLTSTPPDPVRKKEIKAEDIQIGVPEFVPPTEEELTRTGKVTFFNTEKGFGFIRDLDSQQSVFVHVNNLDLPVQENDKVSFQVEKGHRGPAAVKVKLMK